MSKAGGNRALLTSALIVAGIRLYMQIRGKTKTPFGEWAIGWGALFFLLALTSEASPSAAGGLSLMIALSDFLLNGQQLLDDMSKATTGAEKGILVPTPFSSSPAPSTSPPPRGKVKH